VEIFGVNARGESAPLSATGLRIPLSSEAWACLDFRRPSDSVLLVNAGWYRKNPAGNEFPSLALRPAAANRLMVDIHVGPTRTLPALEVFPVNAPEDRKAMSAMLSQTSSGDPLGERLLQDGTTGALDAREFRMACPGGGQLKIELQATDPATLRLALSVDLQEAPRLGVPSSVPQLLLQPNAANLVSLIVRTTTGVAIGP